MELLGAAYAEPTLLKLAYGWEQTSQPRRAPFTTPALVNGAAPAPVVFETVVTGAGQTAGADPGSAARVRFVYEAIMGELRFEADASLAGSERLTALTLQRSDGEKPGPILFHLLTPGQIKAHGSMTLRGRDREDLVAGRVFMHLYTTQKPLGVWRSRLTIPMH